VSPTGRADRTKRPGEFRPYNLGFPTHERKRFFFQPSPHRRKGAVKPNAHIPFTRAEPECVAGGFYPCRKRNISKTSPAMLACADGILCNGRMRMNWPLAAGRPVFRIIYFGNNDTPAE